MFAGCDVSKHTAQGNIAHGLWEVTCQVILHDPSVTTNVNGFDGQNGRKCLKYIDYITLVDLCFCRHGVLLNSKLNHIDLCSASVSMTFTVQ